jgi:hypothetical protein
MMPVMLKTISAEKECDTVMLLETYLTHAQVTYVFLGTKITSLYFWVRKLQVCISGYENYKSVFLGTKIVSRV